jgi:hypothetical protein
MIQEQENITKELTDDGRLVFEPGFCGYLRSQNYQVTGVTELATVGSESDPEKEYLVCKVGTHKYPKDHPELDLVIHDVEIPVCTCWSWRNNSANLEEEKPTECGGCKHTRSVYREEKAESDDNQIQLV